MTFISDRDQQTIREHFDSNLGGNVEIVFFTRPESRIVVPGRQNCETCEPTRELLEEVTALSDKLTLTIHNIETERQEAAALGIDRVPAFVLNGAARGKVRFFGIPSGYEFTAFIDDIIDTANGNTTLSQETRDYLTTVTEDIEIKVFTTPT